MLNVNSHMESIVRLELDEGFEWKSKSKQHSVDPDSDINSDEIDGHIQDSKSKKSKKKKIVIEPIEEQSSLLSSFCSDSPVYQELSTLDDCERLVLSFPNSSKAWLLYMVFHLKQAEVDKARSVAEKAIKTISFRHDKEKCNMWLALLNLENLYGTQGSLNDVFQKAILYNEPKDIYNHLLDLYLKSHKTEEAEHLLEVMIKKYKQDKEIWIKFGSFYMEHGKYEKAKQLMERSFKSLEKKYHPDVTAKFAHMEYRYGNSERGKSMFQELVFNYPKRRDILCLYINLLRNCGDEEELLRVSTLLKNKKKDDS